VALATVLAALLLPGSLPAQGRRVRFLVATAAQPGPRMVEALVPDTLRPGDRVGVVYVLPVEPDSGRQFGSGLDEVARLGLHNRYHVIAVAPTFAQVPWYGDHPTDSAVRQEHYLVRDVVPAVERHLPAIAAPHGRFLLGFSKSGWGAFTLLLRHPEVFGAAAAWDAPLMMDALGRFKTRDVFGTPETFERYRVSTLLRTRGVAVGRCRRIVLLGHGQFRRDVLAAHALMDSLGVPHVYRAHRFLAHHWASGWLPDAFALVVRGLPDGGEPGLITPRCTPHPP
jgi:hypothetical protein